MTNRGIRTVSEWAGEMGYDSPKYFSRNFKRNYGFPPKPKLVELRIEKFHEINGEWTCGWTVEQAQYAWDEFGGSFYDAYCCASCGGPGFMGAADCNEHALPQQN